MIPAAGSLLDTNVVSELSKGARMNSGVRAWLEAAPDSTLFLSVVTIGEIRKGIERVRLRDGQKAGALEAWLDGLDRQFGSQALPITAQIADRWGRLQALRSVPEMGAFMAATALEHNLTLVTRNEADFEGLGVTVLNPFSAG